MSRFKPVIGYEGSYEIDSSGVVRSISRDIVINNSFRTHINQCIMATRKNEQGDLVVQLSKNSIRQIRTIKSLVESSWS